VLAIPKHGTCARTDTLSLLLLLLLLLTTMMMMMLTEQLFHNDARLICVIAHSHSARRFFVFSHRCGRQFVLN